MKTRPPGLLPKALRRLSTAHKIEGHTVYNTGSAMVAGSEPRTPTGHTSTRTELCRVWRKQGGRCPAESERSGPTARPRAPAAQVPRQMEVGQADEAAR